MDNPNRLNQPRPLRPAPLSDTPSSSITGRFVLPPRRNTSTAACDTCRTKRTKCDNLRPSCSRCLGSKIKCVYDTKEDETNTQALKRKKAELDKQIGDLMELFGYLHDRAIEEAQFILARIRTVHDPIQVLQSIKDAENLLPHRPSKHRHIGLEAIPNDIVLPAQPWTRLVSDAAVSELVSQFFTRDPYLFPAIDRDTFIAEMRNQNPTQAHLCTPLLVNTICAFSCLYTSHSLAEIFLKESKQLLDDEYGRPSLSSALALYLMYMISVFLGRDRAGIHFRHMSFDMLRYLDLENGFPNLHGNSPLEADERRRLSLAMWGLFFVESRAYVLYHQSPLIHPPSVPRLFDANTTPTSPRRSHTPEISYAGPTSTSRVGAPQPSRDARFFDMACDLAVLQYEIALYNEQHDSTGQDQQGRWELYSKWRAWLLDLASHQQPDANSTSQTVYLRLHASQVVMSLLRPLPLHSNITDENGTILSIRSFYTKEADLILRAIHAYPKTLGSGPSFLTGLALYHSLATLIPSLDDADVATATHELLPLGCDSLRRFSQHFPLFNRLLQAIGALAWQIGKQLPDQALSYIEGSGGFADDVEDIPLSFALPQIGVDLHKLKDERGQRSNQVSQLGGLIARWLRNRPAGPAPGPVPDRSLPLPN